jgi:hypothetical protein
MPDTDEDFDYEDLEESLDDLENDVDSDFYDYGEGGF